MCRLMRATLSGLWAWRIRSGQFLRSVCLRLLGRCGGGPLILCQLETPCEVLDGIGGKVPGACACRSMLSLFHGIRVGRFLE